MERAAELQDLSAGIGPATVLAAPGGREVLVRFEDGASGSVTSTVEGYEARPGDRLLVARGASGAWALAVLSALREAAPVRADDGVSAQLEDGSLTVRDGRGRLLFSHRPDDGVSVIHAPHGDLLLSAPEGSVAIDAGRDIRLKSTRDVAIEGKSVSLEAPHRETTSSLRLDRRGAHVGTPSLSVSAAVARLALLDTTFAATSVSSVVTTARHVIGVAETRAERIIERAKNVYRDVEELTQTRAGRIRQIAQGAMHLVSERTVIKATDEVAIKGEKIHLA